jgi:hypothetical protein
VSIAVLAVSFRFGFVHWAWYVFPGIILPISFVSLLIIRRNVENWRGHILLEAIPPSYPYNSYGERKRYTLYTKMVKQGFFLASFALF